MKKTSRRSVGKDRKEFQTERVRTLKGTADKIRGRGERQRRKGDMGSTHS